MSYVGLPPGLAEALDQLKHSKVYLVTIFVLTSSPGVINMFHILLYIFIAADDPYWCDIPQLKVAGWTDEQIKTVSSPRGPKSSSCEYYDLDYNKMANQTYENVSAQTNKTRRLKCKTFVYKYKNTINSEWGLVCERVALKASVEMVLTLGKAIGATLFGCIADRWGRKKSVTLSALILMGSAMVASFSPWLPLFIIARFLVGLGGVGIYNGCFVLLTEICQAKHRELLGIVFNVSYGFGMMLLALIAYYIRDWRRLHLVLSLPTLCLVIHIWLLPESPKWLISQGRGMESTGVLAKGNQILRIFCQKPITLNLQPELQDKVASLKAIPDEVSISHSQVTETTSCCQRVLGKFYKLFSNRELRTRVIIELYLWTATNLTYYTLSLNCENFGSDRFMFVAAAGLTELGGYLLPVPLLRVMGRCILELSLYSLTGLSLLVFNFVPFDHQIAVMVVAMFARLCVTAVFSVNILHTSELFPVEIRNSAFGIVSTISCVGAMGAPLLVSLLGAIDHKIPSTVCGATMVVAALLSRVLPETSHVELSTTIEEEMTRKKVSLRNCYKFR